MTTRYPPLQTHSSRMPCNRPHTKTAKQKEMQNEKKNKNKHYTKVGIRKHDSLLQSWNNKQYGREVVSRSVWDISGRSRQTTASPHPASSITFTRRFSSSRPAIFLRSISRWLSRSSRTDRPHQSFQHLLQSIQSTILPWRYLISQHPHGPFFVPSFLCHFLITFNFRQKLVGCCWLHAPKFLHQARLEPPHRC
jgi:hypothetical protein